MPSNPSTHKPPLPFQKKLLFSLLTFLFFLLLIFVVGEIIMRVANPPATQSPIPPPYNTAQTDDQLGWRMTPNYSFDGMMKNAGGGAMQSPSVMTPTASSLLVAPTP